MRANEVKFSVARHSAWAPGLESADDWIAWARQPHPIAGDTEPGVRQMPPMLRRRAGFVGKMALEVAFQCADGRKDIPAVFCSRHGEVARAVDLLGDLAQQAALSPTSFGLAVHNASAGLFSIARADRANHLALAAGASSVEHAVIEACSLLADGASEVLLVVYDNRLPEVFADFEDCDEQPYAWAWLLVPAHVNPISLSWSGDAAPVEATGQMPGGLEVLRFYLQAGRTLERFADRRRWRWAHDA